MDSKYEIFCELIEQFDRGCALTEEYDSLSHDYNGVIMFQAEAQMIKMIGEYKGITVSEIAVKSGKTSSACSQLVRKLKKKNWVCQERNEKNNREYKLFLTDEGMDIFNKHHSFEKKSYKRSFDMLSDFTEDELKIYIAIQKKLNESYQLDVAESKDI